MLKDILYQNWMPCERGDELENSCPDELFFLTGSFIRKYYPVAKLPDDKLDMVISKAEEFEKNPEIRLIAWYMYNTFTKSDVRKYIPFPEFIFQLGFDTGIMNLLILLSLIPELEARAERENFPMRYAHDAASRIGTFPVYYAQSFAGRFGIRSRSLHFMLNFKDNPMYRIGRFDFILEKAGATFPHVYESCGKLLCFCGHNWRLAANGERLKPSEPPQADEFLSVFSDDGTKVCGNLIDTSRGFASNQQTVISLDNCRKIASPGDDVLHVHIPAGGKMLPELCRNSCLEALEFFKEKYPERQVKLIFTVSWIANDAWLDYLPDSNMATLIRNSALFPVPHDGKAGLFFVFGREDDDYFSYKAVNSLEKAMLKCLADNRPLRNTGMIFLPLPQAK